ncbi:MAG: type II toxin-antitoxin system VapC family toxin [Gallionella sp.]
MRYLLDTHLIYWWMTNDARLGKATQRLIAQSEIVVSAVSIWEMVLKNAKGKLPLPEGSISTQLEAQGFIVLALLPSHIEAVRGLQCVHNDPFDRLLIAQARDEKLTLLTRDRVILGLDLAGVLEA